MTMIFGVPIVALVGQLVLGLVNGSFYAILSLGIAVIFGVLRIANFAHGAQYMVGAMVAWVGLSLPQVLPELGLPAMSYWTMLLTVPIFVAMLGAVTERAFIRHVYMVDHAYGILLTFGLAMMMEAALTLAFGSSSQRVAVPTSLQGALNLGFMVLPIYRGWVVIASVVVCLCVWLAVERTSLGALLRATTENPTLIEAFGINVPRLLMLTYALGVGLAGLAGVLASPIYQVSPSMGHQILIVSFAVVVIGGMGSILGAILSGYLLGLLEGLTKVFWPELSSTTIFIVMAIVLLMRPAGLFGKPS